MLNLEIQVPQIYEINHQSCQFSLLAKHHSYVQWLKCSLKLTCGPSLCVLLLFLPLFSPLLTYEIKATSLKVKITKHLPMQSAFTNISKETNGPF